MNNEERVIELFNRTELRDGESVIDNRDSVMAKELGLPVKFVSDVTYNYLDSKFRKVYEDSFLKEQFSTDKKTESDSIKNDFNTQIDKLNKKISIYEKNEIKLKREIKYLENENNRFNTDANKLILCKELIIQKIKSKDISKSLGYNNRASLYKLVKRATNMNYPEYKNKILNEYPKTLR